MSVITDYTALLSGGYWNGIEVTGAPVVVTRVEFAPVVRDAKDLARR